MKFNWDGVDPLEEANCVLCTTDYYFATREAKNSGWRGLELIDSSEMQVGKEYICYSVEETDDDDELIKADYYYYKEV